MHGFHRTQWSLHDGTTRGQGFMAGAVQAALLGEMWVTPEGRLVVKPPELSPTGGLAAAAVGADAGVVWHAQLILEEEGEIERFEGTMPLGEVVSLNDPLPLSAWQRIETDFGPVTLSIPGG